MKETGSEEIEPGSAAMEPQHSRKGLGAVGKWLPGVVISGIAIYAIFSLVSPRELIGALGSINLIYLIPGGMIVIVWLLLRALALKVILNNRATIPQTFRAINAGYLLNNILPLRAGEFGKAVILGRSSGLGVSQVLSAIVIERAFDLFYAAALLLAVLPLVLELSWTKTVAIAVLVVVTGGLFALYVMAKRKAAITGWIAKLGRKWPWVRKYIEPQVDSFLSGFAILTDIRQFLLCLMAIGSSWGVAVMMYYIMMFAITHSPPLWWGVFVNSLLAMGIAIPSAPAALGVFEASVAGGLTLLGMEHSVSLAYAVVMHFLQIAITGILGVMSLMKEKQSLESLFKLSTKIRRKEQDGVETTRWSG